MKNTYEMADVAEVAKAQHLILGGKYMDPAGFDWILGPGFYIYMEEDIDENDE
jgi:hypothetical protein